jgi:hypothetical protein
MKSLMKFACRMFAKFSMFAVMFCLAATSGCTPEKPTVDSSTSKGESSSTVVAETAKAAVSEPAKESVDPPEDEFDIGVSFDDIGKEKETIEEMAPSLNAPDHGDSNSSVPADSGDAAEASDGAGTAVELGDGGVVFTASSDWDVVEGKKQFVDYEMSIPKVEGEAEDAANGRLTFSNVGGGVEANIDRWCGQFKQPDGGKTADVTKRTELDIEGNEVVIVDMTGTYVDSMGGGPFSGGKKVDREGYRMMASIIQAGSHGQYTVKFYGPEKTVSANAEAFTSMIKSLRVSD